MALSYFLLLILLPIAVKGDGSIPPGLAPLYDELCNEVECGKGSCEAAPGSPFSFKCNCDPGWKRTRLDNEDDLQFLPCIIPNCDVDYSCMPAPPPLPPNPYNTSAFDPCYWVYCGEGTCEKNLTSTHICKCNPGLSNLLNISVFPCYSDCAIGSNSCQNLGLNVSKSTSNPSPNGDNSNQAVAFSLGKLNWMIVLLATAAVAFRK